MMYFMLHQNANTLQGLPVVFIYVAIMLAIYLNLKILRTRVMQISVANLIRFHYVKQSQRPQFPCFFHQVKHYCGSRFQIFISAGTG